MLEEQSLYDRIGPLPNGGGTNMIETQGEMPDSLRCPSSDPSIGGASVLQSSSYWGVAGARLEGQTQALILEKAVCGDLHRNGLLFPGSRVSTAKVVDGTSKTLAIGERTYLFRTWITGSTWAGNPPTKFCTEAANQVAYPMNADNMTFGFFVGHNPLPTGGQRTMLLNDLPFGSYHTGGAHFGYADGSVHYLSEDIDQTLLEGLATIDGGEVTE